MKSRSNHRRNAGGSTNPLPKLNTVEEYSSDFENGDYEYPGEKSLTSQNPSCPDITEEEWAQIVNSMTPEEWTIFISMKDSLETESRPFDLEDSDWPGLGHKKDKSDQAVLSVEEDSVENEDFFAVDEDASLKMTDGFVAVEDENSNRMTDVFVAVEDEDSNQSWALLSTRDDADSVVSWSTAPLSFREALLMTSGPVKETKNTCMVKCEPKSNSRKVKDENEEEDDTFYELRESAKTMKGGKPQYRVKDGQTRKHNSRRRKR